MRLRAGGLVWCAAGLFSVSGACAVAQHQANFETEKAQADAMYRAGKVLDVLPLYEDLCRQEPKDALFAERHAAALLGAAENTTDAKKRQELDAQATLEIKRAQDLGDKSPLIIALAGRKTPIGTAISGPMGGTPLTVGYTYAGTPQAQQMFRAGEEAFGHGEFQQAADMYTAAAKADPKFHAAALCVGDSNFRLKNWQEAGAWFTRAIAIDPDRETAYRYWADALWASGDHEGAKAQVERAVVAEPYSKTTWGELQQLARAMHTQVNVPRVQRPNWGMKDGKALMDAAFDTETGNGLASWKVYAQKRIDLGAKIAGNQWMVAGATAANGQQTPSGYVHSLAEEMGALHAMLDDVQAKLKDGRVTEEKLDPGLRALLALDRQGMLEPFVMLSFNDAGLRVGYPAYRREHREEVVAYLDRVVMASPAAAQ